MRTLPDRIFREIEDSRKNALAKLIKDSHLTHTAISEATGVGRSAIKRAVDCKGIRFDTAVRIEYFLEWYKHQA